MKAKLKIITLCVFAATTLAAPLHAAELSAADKQFLGTYEKLHVALAADDLAAAKSAAAELGDDGKAIVAADKIETARAEFVELSDRAIKTARGQDGYHVAHCPMLKKSWVQTSTEITNPYAGKAMLNCGVIKK